MTITKSKTTLFLCGINLLCGMTGCSITTKLTPNDLIGKYHLEGIIEISQTMQLKSDSTFIYDWQSGGLFGQTNGTWQLHGNKIILKSMLQPQKNNDGFIVEVANECTSQKTAIQVKDENGNPLPFATCTIYSNNNKMTDKTDLNGSVSFNLRSVDKIEISLLGFKSISFKSKAKSNNNFDFILSATNKSYQYFTNEKWVVKNGKLYDYKIKTNKWAKNYYEKIPN